MRQQKSTHATQRFHWCWSCFRPVRPVVLLPGWPGSCPACKGQVIGMSIGQLRGLSERAGWSEEELLRWIEVQEQLKSSDTQQQQRTEKARQQREAREAAERLRRHEQSRCRQNEAEAEAEASKNREDAARRFYQQNMEAKRHRRQAEQWQAEAEAEAERLRRHKEARARQHQADEARRQEEDRRRNEERARQQREQQQRQHEQNRQRMGRRRQAMTTEEARHVLGVGPEASATDLKRAYRRLAKQFHPDLHADPTAKEQAQQQMVRVNQAYLILRPPGFRSVGARPPRSRSRRSRA